MAGLKEPGTAGTSDCVVMFVHILIVGRQALVNPRSSVKIAQLWAVLKIDQGGFIKKCMRKL